MKKRWIALLLLVVLCLSLVACTSVKPEDVTGCHWVHRSGNSGKIFELNTDGTYLGLVFRNGSVDDIEMGDWEIKGNKVILYDSDSATYHGVRTEYKYKNGKLYNGSNEYERSYN